MNDRPPLQPKDDLRPRFARADPDSAPKTSFKATPTAVATRPNDAAGAITSNEQLLAEIRALQPEAPSPRPERTPVDLNGIQPTFLLLGAASYGLASAFGFQFAVWAAGFFESHPLDEDAFYVVARLSTVARAVVVAMAALGTGVTAIASIGQLALMAQVMDGIRKGELDPSKERVDPYGGRKQGELEKMLRLMLGDKLAGL
eukprot:CAMPEP_0174713236 /NCGR_PEP_ID=MMETSP1094-20130205/13978_1 /TAXON_ID=156173 /ORGANISM="Chrysochromulina brevifilum, Strain UTEX LB 985" /LENGTH=201 /DNA_ID=CAMNT_0015912399 /DNA_START=144 /DNA_END=749 /DNA_ORIENTATION=-